MLAMHRQFMALNKPQQFCEQPAPPNLVRSTDQLSVMQEYLEKGYQLDLVACMPNSADSKAAYLRYDQDANTVTEISSQDHFDPNTDVPLPVKAYLIPAGLKANSQVLLAPMIHPFGVDFFYGYVGNQLDKTNLEFNQASSSSTLPQTSLSSIPRLVEALWDGNAIQVKQLSSPVVYTARTASAVHWAEAQGYALQFVESSKHSSDNAISAAYIQPKNINEGDRVFISDLIQQYPKEIIATANHQSTSYITQCEGIITQQGIELIIPEPVEILGLKIGLPFDITFDIPYGIKTSPLFLKSRKFHLANSVSQCAIKPIISTFFTALNTSPQSYTLPKRVIATFIKIDRVNSLLLEVSQIKINR